MKIRQLITESDVRPSRLPGQARWYHCGPDFEQFSTMFMGRGENNHLLGFGVYFINNPHIAAGYAKYVRTGDPVLYEVALNATSSDFYCSRNKPDAMQGYDYNNIAKALGHDTYRDVPLRHSIMRYGRGLPGAVFERLGIQRGIELLVQHGVLGQFEDCGDGVYEIAVYDTSIIQILNKTPVVNQP